MSSLKYWVWLASLKGVGAHNIQKLLEIFETPEKLFFADNKELKKLGWLTDSQIGVLSNKSMEIPSRIIDSCINNRFRILTYADAEYPMRLRNIYDPPCVLYVKGNLPVIDDEAALAVVGTRNCTPYGIRSAERISYEYTKCGGLIVSGLARGIDSAAARGALRAGGKVIGVIGSGLDVVYPYENRDLFHDVAEVGAIISEYPPGTKAYGGNFPMRNRILSGISVGVLVIEAPRKSGALITAARALEQGRDIFVLPGNADAEACFGSNELIKEGASAVTEARDIVNEYMPLYPDVFKKAENAVLVPLDKKEQKKLVEKECNNQGNRHNNTKKVIDNEVSIEYIDLVIRNEKLDGDELLVVKQLKNEAIHVDEIIVKSDLPAHRVLSALTMLELKGIVFQLPGKMFALDISEK